jgi:hypothetical protein
MPIFIEHRTKRERIATRIDTEAHATIERIAKERRTTPAHVARVILEDAVCRVPRSLVEAITP